jgi:hypothetical protein
MPVHGSKSEAQFFHDVLFEKGEAIECVFYVPMQ